MALVLQAKQLPVGTEIIRRTRKFKAGPTERRRMLAAAVSTYTPSSGMLFHESLQSNKKPVRFDQTSLSIAMYNEMISEMECLKKIFKGNVGNDGYKELI